MDTCLAAFVCISMNSDILEEKKILYLDIANRGNFLGLRKVCYVRKINRYSEISDIGDLSDPAQATRWAPIVLQPVTRLSS